MPGWSSLEARSAEARTWTELFAIGPSGLRIESRPGAPVREWETARERQLHDSWIRAPMIQGPRTSVGCVDSSRSRGDGGWDTLPSDARASAADEGRRDGSVARS